VRIVGLISGTSYDGIDAAVVDFTAEGSDLVARIEHSATTAYPPQVSAALHRAAHPRTVTMAEVARLDTWIGQAFAAAAAAAAKSAAGPVDLLCSHGQTVFHWVAGGGDHAPVGTVLGTLQLGQPAWIAERTGIAVLSDVRARDIAAGGQGAPLVPLLDLLLLADLPGRAAALNIGGIANITVAGDPPSGYDTGPGNALIDLVAKDATGAAYDVDGALAGRGQVDERALAAYLTDPYFARRPPKSTGREYFDHEFLDRHSAGLNAPDLAATVTALTAESIAAELRRHRIDTVLAAGGGIDNPVLRGMLADRLPGVQVLTSAEVGLPPDAKEAVAFALIGWYGWHGLSAAVPACTGATTARLLGSLTPGGVPLRLPEAGTDAPHRLRIS
jgi:anhydro-N-acetylmuramic acid kinase